MSRSWEELNERTIESMMSENFDTAMENAYKALSAAREECTDKEVLTSLSNLAQVQQSVRF